MKVAMWAVMLFIIGIFGTVLINIFGNITTTNQQDYTLIRNTVEASMYDSIDKASYRGGFYLCPKYGKYTTNSTTGALVFDSKDDYGIFLKRAGVADPLANIGTDYEKNKCQDLYGEVKINADVFVESFIRRFAENVNNNKSYRVTVQDVIEYPPKVSIRIDTYNTYNSSESTTLDFEAGDFDSMTEGYFNIQNQVDAIFEEKLNNK